MAITKKKVNPVQTTAYNPSLAEQPPPKPASGLISGATKQVPQPTAQMAQPTETFDLQAYKEQNPITPVTPIERDVNRERETVSGQLDTLLAKDSPYIAQARNRARQTANTRGLINSSIAAGAGEQAAISQALPIAQQDAKTYFEQGRANQDIINKFHENEQAFGLNREQSYQDYRENVGLIDRDTFSKLTLEDQRLANDKELEAVKNQLAIEEWTVRGDIEATLDEIKSDNRIEEGLKRDILSNIAQLTQETAVTIRAIGTSGASAQAQSAAIQVAERHLQDYVNLIKITGQEYARWVWYQ